MNYQLDFNVLSKGDNKMLEVIKNRRSVRTYIDKDVKEENLILYSLVSISYSTEENKFIDKFDKNKIYRNRFE